MATIEVTFPADGPPGKILKWRVRSDTMVAAGRILLLYQSATPAVDDEKAKEPERKLRATNFGRVKQLLAKEGDVVQPGQVIVLLEGCTHPTVMIDLCAECGADLRIQEANKDGNAFGVSQASVAMVHSIPELKVCPELAEKIGKEDKQRLLTDRKLVLLVDLDQTIVHTTNDNIPPNLKDVFHFQLYGPNSPWYHTRLRPNTRHFLSEMSRLYELHICTFGARIYAHTVASLLDKDGVLFSHRILSRDECFDPASKTANLKALFPCGDDLVCIIDDREDVWQGCGNLVQVKPYHFFRHSGNINAPPGLEKVDIFRPPEPVIEDEPCTNSLENKDNKNDNPLNETEQTSDELYTKEKNHDDEKDEKTENEVKETKKKESENTKVDTEENTETNVQSSTEENTETKVQSSTKENTETNVQSNTEENTETNVQSTEEENKTDKEATQAAPIAKTDKDSKQVTSKQETNILDEDDDDYLLYLEDILRRIHTEFYATLDQENTRKSLRDIIPRVRSQVLEGLYLTFSGLIPTHQKLHQSRAYKVARAFGAEVTQDLTEKTTHLVAIRKGTAKANAARKDSNIKIVNSDWLWTCAERWEHVDERLFPLTTQARGSRVPPPHCSSPERFEDVENESTNSFANFINPLMSFTQEDIEFPLTTQARGSRVSPPHCSSSERFENVKNKSTNSFANFINPLMSFTQEEIEFMDKEVNEDLEDMIFEDEENMDDVEECDTDELSGPERKKRKISNGNSDTHTQDKDDKCDSDDDNNDNEDDDNNDSEDDVTERFNRGENISDYVDLGDNSQDSVDDYDEENEEDEEDNVVLGDNSHDSVDDYDEEDNEDDREWNALGAALERGFLAEL
ncbi:RNA polymerase II subunit A C-terminal domain phosphatase isoform X2 [Cardiocondyla obscurior]|uniref:RNA polymerase II subunit A C-terminal domain phosphatase isoform X2 n=1 Tax=Cardiocondyla obscurior TaxID=286306 RepID=UPI0039656C43